ncbi:TetR/AcrR family transcriptional regulator [Catenuloplanes japonicus]|uniref:TetR/AcrR family transcriptional regulator n=1 Tax=Catenuloplanes japonicus TaxID=33876 RepID=UPI00052609A1|nr:TetR/AcrR family transcriptional regulator [Catenuloplanes japonicus]
MVSRLESAAATRQALLDAAADLLNTGGLEAVTLRAVGARAGVTRGAPYRHFADKESLLIAIGSAAWDRIAEHSAALRADGTLPPVRKLRAALVALIDIGRAQPHLYRLMFSNPPGDPAALARAARRSHDEFLAIVGELVGAADARRYGALLIGSVGGITGMEVSGQLADPKWSQTPEDLVDTLVEMVAHASRA